MPKFTVIDNENSDWVYEVEAPSFRAAAIEQATRDHQTCGQTSFDYSVTNGVHTKRFQVLGTSAVVWCAENID